MVKKPFSDSLCPAALPEWERLFYIIVWPACAAYSLAGVYIASQEHDLNQYDMVDGWKVIGRKQDKSDFEWTFWYGWFWELWPWLLGHIAIGQVCVHLKQLHCLRAVVFITYSLLTILYFMGWKSLLLFLGHVLVSHLAAFTRSTIIVWITCLGLLSTLNHKPFTLVLEACAGTKVEEYYFLVLTIAMANLRYIGSSLEVCWQRKRQREAKTRESEDVTTTQSRQGEGREHIVSQQHYTVTHILLYNFYLPLFFTGPIITMDEFIKQFYNPWEPWNRQQLLTILKGVLRVIFWASFIQLILHYMYFGALQNDHSLMEKLPLWTLAGVGYCHGQIFMVKYVAIYGAARTVALCDKMYAALQPRCISWVYLYSQMWKYIYIPLGGSRQGVIRQTLASFACFTFVFYWHGAELHLFYWVIINFVGITMETIGSHVTSRSDVRTLEAQWLSAAGRRRLHALCVVPLFAGSCIAIFSFFGGWEIGYMFFERLFIKGGLVSIVTVVVGLYCCVQTAKEIEIWKYEKHNME